MPQGGRGQADRQATGREVESPNKWRAIYILGQIYHSLGQAAEAIREYRRVEDRFADAKEAIDYFLRKAIELPEVTTVKPGQPAEVELKFRNVAACDVKVYRIDLMKFSLLKRNLGGITQINLAGIRPLHEATVPLGDGKDYRDRTHKLPLPLEGRRGVPGGLPRRQPARQRPGAGHAAGGRGAGGRRVGPVRTTVKDASDRPLPERRARQGDRQPQRRFRLRRDRPAGRVRGRRHPRHVDGDRPGGAGALRLFPRPDGVGPPLRSRPCHERQPPSCRPPRREGRAARGAALENLQESNAELQRQQVEQLQQMYDTQEQGVKASKAF